MLKYRTCPRNCYMLIQQKHHSSSWGALLSPLGNLGGRRHKLTITSHFRIWTVCRSGRCRCPPVPFNCVIQQLFGNRVFNAVTNSCHWQTTHSQDSRYIHISHFGTHCNTHNINQNFNITITTSNTCSIPPLSSQDSWSISNSWNIKSCKEITSLSDTVCISHSSRMLSSVTF